MNPWKTLTSFRGNPQKWFSISLLRYYLKDATSAWRSLAFFHPHSKISNNPVQYIFMLLCLGTFYTLLRRSYLLCNQPFPSSPLELLLDPFDSIDDARMLTTCSFGILQIDMLHPRSWHYYQRSCYFAKICMNIHPPTANTVHIWVPFVISPLVGLQLCFFRLINSA